jgi:hypothetical protein
VELLAFFPVLLIEGLVFAISPVRDNVVIAQKLPAIRPMVKDEGLLAEDS